MTDKSIVEKGRTIKNILRTASCYANAEEQPLSGFHISVVAHEELVNPKDQAVIDRLDRLLSPDRNS